MHGLTDFFEFHQWANAILVDFCEGLDDATLDAEEPGSYGTVRGALTHMFATQNEFLSAIDGAPPASLFNGMPFPGFAELRETARVTDAAFLAIARGRSPDETIRATWSGRDYEFNIMVPLVQTVNHGIEHRTEIQSILSRRGVTAPVLNGWVWAGLAQG
jgi:uncharacterized damage-inducible protein DinB